MVTKSEKFGRLPYAVGKQPSIPLINLGRTWTMMMIDDDECSSRFRPRSDPVHSLFRGGHQHRRAPRSQGSRFRRRLTSLWSHRSK